MRRPSSSLLLCRACTLRQHLSGSTPSNQISSWTDRKRTPRGGTAKTNAPGPISFSETIASLAVGHAASYPAGLHTQDAMFRHGERYHAIDTCQIQMLSMLLGGHTAAASATRGQSPLCRIVL
jgi:hypothetical protein